MSAASGCLVMESATNPDEAAATPSILLIDDDVELCEAMEQFFARRNIRLEAISDGPRGLARARSAAATTSSCST